MWDWAHFKGEGWLAHVKRSAKLSGSWGPCNDFAYVGSFLATA